VCFVSHLRVPNLDEPHQQLSTSGNLLGSCRVQTPTIHLYTWAFLLIHILFLTQLTYNILSDPSTLSNVSYNMLWMKELEGGIRRRLYLNEVAGCGSGPHWCDGAMMTATAQRRATNELQSKPILYLSNIWLIRCQLSTNSLTNLQSNLILKLNL
jgi:hypothetical protein